jgi:hypothetical protein
MNKIEEKIKDILEETYAEVDPEHGYVALPQKMIEKFSTLIQQEREEAEVVAFWEGVRFQYDNKLSRKRIMLEQQHDLNGKYLSQQREKGKE